MRLAALRTFGWRVGVGALVTSALLRAEGMRVVRDAGVEVAGPWESLLLSKGVPALALVVAFPAIVVVALYGACVPSVQRRSGRWAWAVAAALVAGTLAIDLTTGRKAHAPSVRVPFVLAMIAVASITTWLALPTLHAQARRRPWVSPLLGTLTLVAAALADHRVLPRLYLPFHLALEGAMIVAAVMLGEPLVALGRRFQARADRWKYAVLALDALALYGMREVLSARGKVTWAGESLAKYDNARRIVSERSDVLGRVAELAAKKWPPPPLDLGDGTAEDPLADDASRTLDAQGRDVLLVTIDALRADHVGAYGYGRATTPSLDALSKEGVVFERAYTATPHTSYAISSLMTGKYMRPILALEASAGGVRRPDETFALLLRNYGFRTAAFYPPAIFFVDADRFVDLQKRGLDFEYSKIEFAAPDLRAAQLRSYLGTSERDHRLFAWVHLFEPHEPYVGHPEHDFGDGELDRYDSEIAAADDGLGAMVQAFRAARPNAIVIVTADHGEAFGEHGARYHGTTVYEEQVRVPLVISAPGLVAAGRRVDRPVQLVDLLPTILSAYGIPKPPRVRGRDLGELLAAAEPKPGEGVAFAEVDDAAMLAKGARRLVCNRRNATCALYDVHDDPGELHPLAEGAETRELKKSLGALIAASAKLEGFAAGGAASLPEPLRRALAGEPDAAIEVAPLLDDVDVTFRRRAAEALGKLARPETSPHVIRALGRETDALTRSWLFVARVRIQRSPSEGVMPNDADEALAALVEKGVEKGSGELRRFAALSMGEGALRRTLPVPPLLAAHAFVILAEWLPHALDDAELARAIIDVLPALRSPDVAPRATKPLLDALDDVRLRVEAARALGKLGDHAAAPLLAKRLANERHLDARAGEALALARVGDRDTALGWFSRILGVPEPAPGGGAALAEAIAELGPPPWARRNAPPSDSITAALMVPKGLAHRVVIATSQPGVVRVRIDGGAWVEVRATDEGAIVELGDRFRARSAEPLKIEATSTSAGSIVLVALVARVDDLPPPKPDRGVSGAGDGDQE